MGNPLGVGGMLAVLTSGWILPPLAEAQEFTHSDSIEVHGLVYIGKLDRALYGYADSVHCQFVVANRSPDPITIRTLEVCTGFYNIETWCDTTGTARCTPSEPLAGICYQSSYTYVFETGEHLIGSAVVPSKWPGGEAWDFAHGGILFVNPWRGPAAEPYFTFFVRYRRERETMRVSAATWARIKGIYR